MERKEDHHAARARSHPWRSFPWLIIGRMTSAPRNGQLSHADSLMHDGEAGASSSSGGGSVRGSLSIFQVEARLRPTYKAPIDEIRRRLQLNLESAPPSHVKEDSMYAQWHDDEYLSDHIEEVRICECASRPSDIASKSIGAGKAHAQRKDRAEARFVIHAYYAAPEDDIEELMTGDAEGEERTEGDSMAATVLELPNASLEGVWDNLIYEDNVKQRLLNYIQTTLVYSDAQIDFNIIAWNRLVLLHGPPGTGKTSLCRALAQKLAIRLSHRYAYGKLIEINSHSLFSKWFSESGKLVQRLFSMVTEMVADEDAFIVVLIDEVESLTASRSAAVGGTEPGDAVRVVNALLTQLDKLKTRKNCLVLTTSNLSDTIDDAFLDRADIKQYIGPPPAQAIYAMLLSCANELMRVGLVAPDMLLPWSATAQGDDVPSDVKTDSDVLAQLACDCKDLSGRTLRKLPVLTHARYLISAQDEQLSTGAPAPISLGAWLEALGATIADTRHERDEATPRKRAR